MLADAQNYLRDHQTEARLYVFGQDLKKRAYATATSDMLMKHADLKTAEEKIMRLLREVTE